ncbi:MAG: hypothetical protein PHH68_01225 [Candidatus Omnitrophica bacterium]|nr:hypothetical protein [Candidatus Omnitrophota bacterium]MDD5078932.1 hypothetical protein [Candidatus Omnitrophota bacterium]
MKVKNVFLFIMIICWTVSAGHSRGLYLYAQTDNAAGLNSPAVTAEPGVDYSAQDYRDPFDSNLDDIPVKQPEVSVEVAQDTAAIKPPEMNIQGIFWGGSYAQAIIDNKVVKVGDSIKGAKITVISKDGIKILFSGKDFNLSAPGASSQALAKTADKKKKLRRSVGKRGEKEVKKTIGNSEAEEGDTDRAPQDAPAGDAE